MDIYFNNKFILVNNEPSCYFFYFKIVLMISVKSVDWF